MFHLCLYFMLGNWEGRVGFTSNGWLSFNYNLNETLELFPLKIMGNGFRVSFVTQDIVFKGMSYWNKGDACL